MTDTIPDRRTADRRTIPDRRAALARDGQANVEHELLVAIDYLQTAGVAARITGPPPRMTAGPHRAVALNKLAGDLVHAVLTADGPIATLEAVTGHLEHLVEFYTGPGQGRP